MNDKFQKRLKDLEARQVAPIREEDFEDSDFSYETDEESKQEGDDLPPESAVPDDEPFEEEKVEDSDLKSTTAQSSTN